MTNPHPARRHLSHSRRHRRPRRVAPPRRPDRRADPARLRRPLARPRHPRHRLARPAAHRHHPGRRRRRPGHLGRDHHPRPRATPPRPSRPPPRTGHHHRHRPPASRQLRAARHRLRGRPGRPHRPHHRGHHRHPPAVAVGQAGHARPPRGWHSPHRCPRRARPHPHRQHPHRRRRTHNRRHPGRRRPRRLPCPGQRSTRHPPACLLNTGCDRPLSRSAKTSCTRPACHPAGRAPAATANTRPPLLRSPDHKTLPRQRNPS